MKNKPPPLKDLLEPPWDDLREQRNLARVLDTWRDERLTAPRRRVPRVAVIASVGIAVAVAAVITFMATRPRVSTVPGPVASLAPTTPTKTPAPSAAAPETIALADGSQAFLLHDANLMVEVQRPDSVSLLQRRGQVRYEVRPDPTREFLVHAGNATVRVRGTIFTVALDGEFVDVRVDRGKVEVSDGARVRELVAGESLRVASAAPPLTDADASAASIVEAGVAEEHAGDERKAPSAAELQSQADNARLAGRNDDASVAIHRLVQLYPRDARVPAALFSLARVERARGQHAAAARAFEQCVSAAPSGPLASDALSEAALSWTAAGAPAMAKADAMKYLAKEPGGPRSAAMRSLAGP
jgi:transmembrane sensor